MWFITVFNKIDYKDYTLSANKYKTCGYYSEKETAIQALHENWNDIRENYYNYAVIEYIEEGITVDVTDRYWFKWNDTKNGFFEIDEPEYIKFFAMKFAFN